jgi:hypothetical protein
MVSANPDADPGQSGALRAAWFAWRRTLERLEWLGWRAGEVTHD